MKSTRSKAVGRSKQNLLKFGQLLDVKMGFDGAAPTEVDVQDIMTRIPLALRKELEDDIRNGGYDPVLNQWHHSDDVAEYGKWDAPRPPLAGNTGAVDATDKRELDLMGEGIAAPVAAPPTQTATQSSPARDDLTKLEETEARAAATAKSGANCDGAPGEMIGKGPPDPKKARDGSESAAAALVGGYAAKDTAEEKQAVVKSDPGSPEKAAKPGEKTVISPNSFATLLGRAVAGNYTELIISTYTPSSKTTTDDTERRVSGTARSEDGRSTTEMSTQVARGATDRGRGRDRSGAGPPDDEDVDRRPTKVAKRIVVCRYWEKDGRCRYGDRCHFLHDDPDRGGEPERRC